MSLRRKKPDVLKNTQYVFSTPVPCDKSVRKVDSSEFTGNVATNVVTRFDKPDFIFGAPASGNTFDKIVNSTHEKSVIMIHHPQHDGLAKKWLNMVIESTGNATDVSGITNAVACVSSTILVITGQVGVMHATKSVVYEIASSMKKGDMSATAIRDSVMLLHPFNDKAFVHETAANILSTYITKKMYPGYIGMHLPTGLVKAMGAAMLQPLYDLVGRVPPVLMGNEPLEESPLTSIPFGAFHQTVASGPNLPRLKGLYEEKIPNRGIVPGEALESVTQLLNKFVRHSALARSKMDGHTELASTLAVAFWATIGFCQFPVTENTDKHFGMAKRAILDCVEKLARQSLDDHSDAGDFKKRIKYAYDTYDIDINKSTSMFMIALNSAMKNPENARHGFSLVHSTARSRGRDVRELPWIVVAGAKNKTVWQSETMNNSLTSAAEAKA